MSEIVLQSIIDTPVGPIRLWSRQGKLIGLYFATHKGMREGMVISDRRCDVLQRAANQLAEYFDGRRRLFDLPLAVHGTAFQQRVWAELQRISFGDRISYTALARRVGHPAAKRAVGSANGRNPISIVIPCHRVVAASGRLAGFAGGVAAKQWLLDHEARQVNGTY
jgi:methylated-DNA-[protein]-cysteine S-methyltransferase